MNNATYFHNHIMLVLLNCCTFILLLKMQELTKIMYNENNEGLQLDVQKAYKWKSLSSVAEIQFIAKERIIFLSVSMTAMLKMPL